jgi:hypothetical protein
VAGLPLVVAPVALSDDVFRYLWDGRVLLHGIDPYRFAPDDPALAFLRDGAWERVNNASIPTIYPPFSQALFGLAAALYAAPVTLKAFAFAAHLATVPLVGRLAGADGPRASLLFALNPLALSAAALDGHVDAVTGLAVAGFTFALVTGRSYGAALCAGAASGLKLVGVVLAPLIAARSRRAAAVGGLLALLCVVPLVGAGTGSDAPGGLGQYARRWGGNAGGFLVLETAVNAGLESAADPDVTPGHIRLDSLRPWLERVRGTFVDPWRGVLGEKKVVPDVAEFEIPFLASLLARALAFAIVLTLVVALTACRARPLTAVRTVLLATLLLAPQVHPWYLLWLLPIEVAAGGVAGLLWSATVLVAYGPLDGWLAHRQWHPVPYAQLFQYGVVGLALAGEALDARFRTVVRASERARGPLASSR